MNLIIEIKKKCIFTLVLIIISQLLSAQSISRNKANQIESFIKEWGEIKYFKIQNSPTKNIDSFFVSIIDCILYNVNCDADISKFRKEFKTSDLPSTHKLKHYFVSHDNSRAVLVSNDTAYHSLMDTLPSIGIRLLTLAKIWCTIDFFSPYKNFSKKNWSTSLPNQIRKAVTINSEVSYNLWLLSIVANLKDGHAAVTWKKSLDNHLGRFKYVPYSGKIIKNRVFITKYIGDSSLSKQKLQKGDQVISIDGIQTKKLIKEYGNLVYNYSNTASKNTALFTNFLFRGKSDSVNLQIKRDGKMFSIKVKRFMYQYEYFQKSKKPILTFITDSIAYLNMGDLNASQVDSIAHTIIQKAKHLIIDLRNYPNNTWIALSNYFGSKSFIMSKLTYPNLLHPGTFNEFPNRIITPTVSSTFLGKILLIVDESTKSHAEFSAMGLQAACNAITIGTTTAGTIGNVTNWIPLPNGYKFRFSGLGVYYPDGNMVHKYGIKIDIQISPSRLLNQIKKDYLLEQSIQYIQNKY